MFDGEDLTINEQERAAGRLLRWLNERGCDYHIEASEWIPDSKPDGGLILSLFDMHRELEARRMLYDIFIYDESTAALMALFHEGFEEIISPEVLKARAAEIKAAEEEAARIGAIREAEDQANAKRVARGQAPKPSSLETPSVDESSATNDASPPTRAFLERIGKSLRALASGRHKDNS